jgi:cytochrome c oxidase subunit 4
MPKPPSRLVWSWFALLVLLTATLGLAYVPLGSANVVVALAIGAVKAVIVALVFMELARGLSLRWIFAGAGLLWLLVLFGLSLTDYATRRGWPAH